MKKTNRSGIDLIKSYESLQLKAYKDLKGILTIGYGHTGQDVFIDQEITEVQAELLLRNDLTTAEDAVARCMKVAVTDNEFSACVSLAFNIGITAFANSTLVKLINEKKFDEAGNEFLRWDHVNGKVIDGLLRRREEERELFFS